MINLPGSTSDKVRDDRKVTQHRRRRSSRNKQSGRSIDPSLSHNVQLKMKIRKQFKWLTSVTCNRVALTQYDWTGCYPSDLSQSSFIFKRSDERSWNSPRSVRWVYVWLCNFRPSPKKFISSLLFDSRLCDKREIEDGQAARDETERSERRGRVAADPLGKSDPNDVASQFLSCEIKYFRRITEDIYI